MKTRYTPKQCTGIRQTKSMKRYINPISLTSRDVFPTVNTGYIILNYLHTIMLNLYGWNIKLQNDLWYKKIICLNGKTVMEQYNVLGCCSL